MKRERIDLEHVPLERSPLIESESSMRRQGDPDPRVVDVKVSLSFDTPVGIVLLPEMTVSIGITVFQRNVALDDLWVVEETACSSSLAISLLSQCANRLLSGEKREAYGSNEV
jgi:hypothetical protein